MVQLTEDREKELIELCKKFKNINQQYNCLVAGSGGKDSIFQSHILKYKIWNETIDCDMGAAYLH